MSRSGTVRIGISGWTYGGWRGSFYPSGLHHSDELSYASRQVDTIEIRHPSFLDPAFVALLRRHRIALVFADSVAWPYAEDLTADFVYLRLHGSEELYTSGYADEALDHWAARIKLWARGLQPNDARLIAPDLQPPRRTARDVYVYFDNDAKVRAPADARSLCAKLA